MDDTLNPPTTPQEEPVAPTAPPAQADDVPVEPAAPAITASVGKIVLYQTRGSADGVYPPTKFAAIVTEVADDGTASLFTIGKSGFRFETGVIQGDQPGQWDFKTKA